MKRTAMEKITPTKELKEYYQKVIDFCKTNNVPYKKLHPIGLQINVSDIPKDKIDEWILTVSKN